MNTPAYQTIIVKFREAITELDGIFRDTQFWGVATLKEWIDDYEGSRFTAIDTHTAVITSEYNMECVGFYSNRKQYEINPFISIVEMQPDL